MVFSGHTTFMCLCACVFHFYSRKEQIKGSPRFLRCLYVLRKVVYLITVLGVLSIISTRLHYTLDVSIAVYITLSTWTNYHTLVRAIN